MTAKSDSTRPIAPHLQVYKWGPAMLVSMMHRITGDGLAIAGGCMLLWWLGALATGPDAYANFLSCVWLKAEGAPLAWTNWVGRAVLIGLTWAFFQHMFSGMRHLLLDTGAGYELKANRNWSIIVVIAGLFATAALWGYIFARAI
ncbi:MAG: succinate dehydrogenase, cytochrome b556 subunit [Pseudomonadota bacterium]